MDIEKQREAGRRGGLATQAQLTAEERKKRMTHIVTMRWEMRKVFGPYPRQKNAEDRLEWYLRGAQRLIGEYNLKGDWDKMADMFMKMFQIERTKIALERQKAGLKSVESEDVSAEVMLKLAEARERRERALNATEAEVVLEERPVEKPRPKLIGEQIGELDEPEDN